MKRVLILLMACFCFFNVHAAYLRNIPMTLNQPDGTVLQCFASGDEFFNYLHDKDGYTIIQHPQTGYYVYAENRDGKLVATEFVAGIHDPASKGLKPFALISPEAWRTKRQAWKEPEKESQNRDNRDANHGTLNNISVFIRFSDDPELTNSYSSIDNMFNDVSEGAVSMRSYFRAASYGAIEIPTTFYPGHNGEAIISYQDIYPRSYFQPYNESTNTNGYQNDDESREREFSLLQRAVNYINNYYPIPTNLDIDYDSDGYVDNVCFIVKGSVGAWNSLLWPHKWSLYDRDVYINGKRVWTFNFQLADATGYFNTSTMCHEMNHSLGAPDLYHYYHGEGLSPVGSWDLMENNATPPQHCGAYMKMKYGHWIDEIPEITQPGTYTLNPISSSIPTNVAYKIPTSDPNQFYVLEYRDKTSLFETALPGSGLLIYRINTSFGGNAGYNPEEDIYDEVYIFRPGGSSTVNGNLSTAHFSSNVGRTEFSSATNPYPFFTDGTPDPGFRIYDITSAESTISFTYGGYDDGSGDIIYIGDEGTNTNNYLPSYSYFNYSLTQQIYTADEIGTAGTINSIAFYNGGDTKTRTFDFYLVATDKTSFDNSTDWVAVTDVNKVFSGDVTMTAEGWTTIVFDRPFAYDGVSNLILVADDNSGDWTGSPHMSCRVFDAPSKAIRIYSDDNDYDPTTLENYSGVVLNVKNQIKLQIVVPSTESVVIGEGGTNTNNYLPSYSYYNYSLTQQIFTADEIGTNGVIDGIGFYNAGATKTRVYDFYIVASDKTSFSGGDDWIAVTEADKVFSGIVAMTANNWTTIAFDKPFLYDGTSNLILVTDDNSGKYTFSPHMSCRVFDAPSQAIRIYSDNTNYDPMAPQDYSGTVLNLKNQIKMHVKDAGELLVIGDEGTNTSDYLPSYSYYNYSLTQQIYTADEIGTSGIIKSIAFYNGGAEKTRTYNFYLVATDKASFTNNTDWVAVTATDKVFNGSLTMKAGAWTLIEFDKPFVYDGTSNLILVSDDNSGEWTSSPHMSCRVFDAPNQAIRIYSDGTNYNPFAPEDYIGTRMSVKNQILMHIENAGELVIIGDGGTNTNDYLPSYSYYNYSLSQQIYTAEEIGTSGTISNMAFYNDGAEKIRTYDFYMVSTDKNMFANSSDWVAVTEEDKVFSGKVTMSAESWTLIEFDKPFVYDGTSNLILVSDDNSGEWTVSPHMSCRVFDAPQQAIRIYSDYTDYDPSNPTSYYGTMHYDKNQIVLCIAPSPTFTKEINAYTNDGGYYLLSVPFEGINPETVEYMLDNTYDLYAFDESQQQEWINYKADGFDLELGKGYLYANSQDVVLSFKGNPYNGSGEVMLYKTGDAETAGWNLVGNPYAVTAYLDRDFYVMNADGSEIIPAERDYIEPLEGVFVVAENNGEILTFSTTPSTKGPRLVLNLSNGNSTSSATTVIDCAIVSFTEGSMLPKLQIKENSSRLFIRQDGKEYAVVNADDMGEIPVSFRAESNGKYTISANIQGINFGYLHLIDTFTNSDIDLLSTSIYSFEASTGDDDERFKIVFSVEDKK